MSSREGQQNHSSADRHRQLSLAQTWWARGIWLSLSHRLIGKPDPCYSLNPLSSRACPHHYPGTRARFTNARQYDKRVTLIKYGGCLAKDPRPIPSPSSANTGMSSSFSLLPFLPLAIKNGHIISAERYISGMPKPLLLHHPYRVLRVELQLLH